MMLYGKAVRGQTLRPQADTSLCPKGGASRPLVFKNQYLWVHRSPEEASFLL